MKDIEIVEVVVSALPGSNIGNCMKEAMDIAVKEWRNVRLRHNGRDYKVMPNDLLATIKEEK